MTLDCLKLGWGGVKDSMGDLVFLVNLQLLISLKGVKYRSVKA
jgi:hypothetical protein